MKKTLLEIKNLTLATDSNLEIIKDFSLTIKEGEFHAILGPNGNGKTTLLQGIMGNKSYKIIKGKILYQGKKINDWTVTERSLGGIFLSFQVPPEIDGVMNIDYLRNICNVRNKKLKILDFYKLMNKNEKNIKLPNDYLNREMNIGFSGGEKKMFELLQLKLCNPKLTLLDEIDSGLDVDSIKILTKTIKNIRKNNKLFSSIFVSHYGSLYNELKIDKFHVIINGRLIISGGINIFNRILKEGYGWIYKKFGIKRKINKNSVKNNNPVFLDQCLADGNK